MKIPVSTNAWADGTYSLREMTGGGVGLVDFDNDDLLDIVQVCSAPPGQTTTVHPVRLFKQAANHTFSEVTNQVGLTKAADGNGVAVGDFNNDGFPDLFITCFGENILYKNRGDGTFVDVTAEAGLSGENWGVSAAFFDYDGDGDLDLYVVHYVKFKTQRCYLANSVEEFCGPQMFEPTMDSLYRNDNGHFVDVTAASGINKPGRGLGVVCLDFTGDGHPDIFVANDGEVNQLWVNQGNGTFKEEAMLRGLAYNGVGSTAANMGICAGDADGDGRIDLFVTHMRSEGNILYSADAKGFFQDFSGRAGISAIDLPFTGFGCAFIDFDNDGDLDLAVANGRVRAGPIETGAARGTFWNRYAESNLFYENDGKGRFIDARARSGSFAQQPDVNRGLAIGDINGDGRLDMVQGILLGPPRVHLNTETNANHWLQIRAMTGKRDALGAIITVSAGGRQKVQPVLAAYSYASSNDPAAHFGLGTSAKVDSIQIKWPSGLLEQFVAPAVDRRITIVEGTGAKL